METDGELEVTEVPGRELHLVAARVAHDLRRHGRRRVVDEDVQRAVRLQPPRGEGGERGGVGEIELADLDPFDPGHGATRALRIARADGDRRARPGKAAGRLQAEPRVPAGHDHVLASEVEAAKDVVRRRCCRETGPEGVLSMGHVRGPTAARGRAIGGIGPSSQDGTARRAAT